MQKLVNAWQKITTGSINRKIFGAAVIVATLTVLVKVAAVVKELVVAWRFGTDDNLDAFLIALLVPAFIINVVAGSFNAALIPTYIQVRQQQKQAAQKMFSGTTLWGLGLLVIITILMIITAPVYLPLIAAGFSAEKLRLTYQLLCAIAPCVILSGIVVIWSGVLNAGERFALAALSPIITPAITIVLLLLNMWGVFALAAGLVIGTALEIVILGIALHRNGIVLSPKWHKFDTNMRQVANQFTPAIIGAFLMCSTVIVDQSMAAMLSPGSVAALNYGNRVIALPITLATTALSTAIIPYFSQMVATQDWIGVRHTLKHYLRLILATTIPLTALLLICSKQIIQILFQRGSFTASDTELVAQIQTMYALQIPFYVADIFLVKLITSMRLNQILMWVSAFNLIINIVLNYILMQFLGVKGIALSTSCVYLFSFIYVLIFVNINLKKLSN